jgi:dolichol-phosphate mannosyltransferase
MENRMKFIIALPVYNEAPTLEKVLNKLSEFKDADVVVVDDGSTDATPSILERLSLKNVIRHPQNEGYGKSLIDGFNFAKENHYRFCIDRKSVV